VAVGERERGGDGEKSVTRQGGRGKKKGSRARSDGSEQERCSRAWSRASEKASALIEFSGSITPSTRRQAKSEEMVGFLEGVLEIGTPVFAGVGDKIDDSPIVAFNNNSVGFEERIVFGRELDRGSGTSSFSMRCVWAWVQRKTDRVCKGEAATGVLPKDNARTPSSVFGAASLVVFVHGHRKEVSPIQLRAPWTSRLQSVVVNFCTFRAYPKCENAETQLGRRPTIFYSQGFPPWPWIRIPSPQGIRVQRTALTRTASRL